MSLLAHFRIITKILWVVLLMSAVAATIAYVGSGALKSLNETAERINANAQSSVLAARMNVALVAINRAEMKLTADPRPESRALIATEIARESKSFKERFDKLRDLASAASKTHAAA